MRSDIALRMASLDQISPEGYAKTYPLLKEVARREPRVAAGLARMAQFTDAFIAVSNGPLPVLWREDGAIREMAVFPITAVDTLGAGDSFIGRALCGLPLM